MVCRHFTPREDYRSFRPFPVSPNTFQEIFDVLKLPRVFLRILLSNLPFAMRFTPKSNGKPDGRGIIPESIFVDAAKMFPKLV